VVSAQSPHDNAYKHVFSHPRAVADLLRGFVHEDWVTQLDFTTLEKVSGSYVTDDLRDREDDIIWRLRMSRDLGAATPGEWVYVYLLLEFQSSHDPHMAVRILTYVGLLYQDLLKSRSGQAGSGRLPAVFPLVLYNGLRPWTAARQVEDLIEAVPASLSAYRPSLRYFLLDEGRLPQTSLTQPDNAVASSPKNSRRRRIGNFGVPSRSGSGGWCCVGSPRKATCPNCRIYRRPIT
jgi:Putative transposase, YhgA-like